VGEMSVPMGKTFVSVIESGMVSLIRETMFFLISEMSSCKEWFLEIRKFL